ncbi:MAG: hypothetical protein OEX02_12255 [Cyclobacteriaceae bacterium]|nr:hypothetical protein [Cyclobacteriaceae bacterium]
MKIFNKYSFLVLALLTMLFSCEDLDVENTNQPDSFKVYSSAVDMVGLSGALFNTWYHGTHEYDGAGLMFNTAADNTTCSWGNQAMRDMSWEPRKAWDNSPNYSYEGVSKYLFDKVFSANYTARVILKRIEEGMDFGEDEAKVKAMCKFIQGISHGYIGLVFDKAYVVTEDVFDDELASLELVPYTDLRDQAIKSLDEAIAIANASSFTIPAGWLGGDTEYTSGQLAQIINSFAARILSYTPRSKAENGAVDWAKVKNYADNGVSSDFVIQGDGWNEWYNEHMIYSVYPGWGRTDMRIINMMDPGQPARWEDRADFPHPAETAAGKAGVDQRIYSDFQYLSSNNFRTERGYYHFSNYRLSRYDYFIGPWTGDMPEIYVAENDMLRAEARMHLGDLSGAADIINAGTRVTRGGLAPVAVDQAAINAAIHHERQVELSCTGLGIQFFDMRKDDMLQKGTILHLPLPAKVLEILGDPRPFYTFGGTDNADGLGTSSGGWF